LAKTKEPSVKQTLSFDTSGINRLIDPRVEPAVALAAIQTAFHPRLTGTSVDEIIADSEPSRRSRQLDACKTLMREGDVLLPFHELLRNHIVAFEGGRAYSWRAVPFEAFDYRREIALREITTDALSEEQLQHAVTSAEEFETIYADARPHFDAIFERDPDQARPAVEEVLEAFQQPGGSFWEMAARLYERACGHRPDEGAMRKFVDLCPPFRTILYAMVLAQHDRVIAEKTDRERAKLAGRVDVFSATFLPYCAIFVSDDRDQQRFLRKVVELSGLTTEILWFNTFLDRIGVGSQCLTAATHS
jgi:hypothetical protein